MKRQTIIALILSVAIIPSIVGCKGSKKGAAVEQQDSAKIVDTAVAFVAPVSDIQEFTAMIESKIKNNITSQSPMRIMRLNAEVGDRVSRGQVLATLDNSNLSQIKAQMDKAKLDYNRAVELYKVGGYSKAQLDQFQTAYQIVKTQYNNMLTNTVLRSPVSGVVTARNYDNGDMPNMSMPIYVVEQIAPVKLKLNVSEQYYGKLKNKMPVSINVESLPDEDFEGYVGLIYPSVDPTTHTFGVEITIPNRNQKLRPGMYAKATIDLGQHTSIVVPTTAVNKQQGSGERYVFVYNGGKVKRHTVEVGRMIDANYEILSGIDAGNVVVTNGSSSLEDGQLVKINPTNKD